MTDVIYIVLAKEVGTKGTRHIQGFVQFEHKRTVKGLKKMYGKNIHWERRKGTPQQAADYCKKTNVFWERGTLAGQGVRNDLEGAIKLIREKGPQAVCEEMGVIWVRYQRGLMDLYNRLVPGRDRNLPTYVEWRWGLAEAGKSRRVHERAAEAGVKLYQKDNGKWWDKYEHEPWVLIDDFDPKEWNFRDFLKVIDRYPYSGQVKGSYVQVVARTFFITCEFPPEHFWTDNTLAQVTRRLSKVVQVKGRSDGVILQPVTEVEFEDEKN